MSTNEETIRYKRSQFATRLPRDNFYTQSHFWIAPQGQAQWKVGFTKFAVRMLGEIVEQGFEVEPKAEISLGQTVGWVEGFKALTDLYSVISGRFEYGNPLIVDDPEKIYRDPYGDGWLYLASGDPDSGKLNVLGYVEFLDQTIDRIRGETES